MLDEQTLFDREDFSFGGVHCSEHNAVFIVDQWPVAAAPIINKYQIPGRHGTLRYPGMTFEEQTLEGRLYLLADDGEPITYADMLRRKTLLSTWLQADSRQQLIMDAAPDRFYMAEIEHALTITTDEWGNGCLSLAFTLQPFTYSLFPDPASATLDGASAKELTLVVKGNQPAPVAMELTASAALTWVELTLGDDTVRLENMSLAAGQKAVISYDLDAGEIMAVTHNGDAGMAYYAASSPDEGLKAAPGSNTISANADAACTLTLTARGRWQG